MTEQELDAMRKDMLAGHIGKMQGIADKQLANTEQWAEASKELAEAAVETGTRKANLINSLLPVPLTTKVGDS